MPNYCFFMGQKSGNGGASPTLVSTIWQSQGLFFRILPPAELGLTDMEATRGVAVFTKRYALRIHLLTYLLIDLGNRYSINIVLWVSVVRLKTSVSRSNCHDTLRP